MDAAASMTVKTPTLTVNEIYASIQGESTWAGERCVFVRTTFCDLRCSYCDTEYAFYEGSKRPLDEIVSEVLSHDCPLVEITGGEPLLQKNVLPLMTGGDWHIACECFQAGRGCRSRRSGGV